MNHVAKLTFIHSLLSKEAQNDEVRVLVPSYVSMVQTIGSK